VCDRYLQTGNVEHTQVLHMSSATEDPNAAGSDDDYDDLFSADLFLDEDYKLQRFTFGDIEQVGLPSDEHASIELLSRFAQC
jgi:hypothetical protein